MSLLVHVAKAPLTIDQDGERRRAAINEILHPDLVARMGRGVDALIENGKVVVIDLEQILSLVKSDKELLAKALELLGVEKTKKTTAKAG